MDPTDTPIVQRCMAASPNINDYFVERRYIAELEQEECRTPQMLTSIAVNLMLDELGEMGIETNMSAADLLESPMDLGVLFDLRDLFDKDKLYAALKAMTPELYSEFESLIENITLPEDFLYEITDFFSAKTPNDERWTALQAVLDRWTSTASFSKHVVAVMDRVRLQSDPNKAAVDDTNLDAVQAYLLFLSGRINTLQTIADWLSDRIELVDWKTVGRYIRQYDWGTLDPDILPVFAEYHALTRGGQAIPPAVSRHRQEAWHHPEYWKTHKAVPTKEQLVVIVLSAVVEKTSFEKLAPVYDRCDEFGKIFLKQLHDIDYAPILGDTHENPA